MTTQAVAFSKLYISSTGVESPDSFEEVTNIQNYGEIGIAFNKIAFSSVSDGYDRELKGTVRVSSFPVVMNYDASSQGQLDFQDAGEDTTNTLYYFRYQFNDATGSPATPTTFEFQGKVNGFVFGGGGANSVRTANSEVMIEMDTLVRTPAGA